MKLAPPLRSESIIIVPILKVVVDEVGWSLTHGPRFTVQRSTVQRSTVQRSSGPRSSDPRWTVWTVWTVDGGRWTVHVLVVKIQCLLWPVRLDYLHYMFCVTQLFTTCKKAKKELKLCTTV